MQEQDREPIATIALIAALADGDRGPEELAQLNQIAAELGGGDFDRFARQVLAGQARLGDVVAKLSGAEARQKAFELAVAVCHADGVTNEREKAFLTDLRQSLQLDPVAAAAVETAAHQVASMAVVVAPADASAPPGATDDTILKSAMLAGALELLPQGLASMAIIPLQLRMVYRIGADAGQKLDANQVKDLAGVLGIGAAGQVMEGVARNVLGGLARGLFGRILGGVAGGVAGTAAGASLTFATTYALGHAAKQYYAQGRRLSQDDLRALFARLKDEAQTIFPRVEAQIRQQASTLNLPAVLQRLRA
jgi:uncharacterized protein (DUF697 family)/tellurite resistance protein